MVYTILSIIVAVVSVIICLVICLQEAKQSGLGAGIAGGSADSYWSKNKSRSKEGKLVRITVVAAVAFFVISILLNISAVVG